MTPEQIQSTRELLASLPEDERPTLARAAAEFIRLHDAIERLYRLTADDVRHETDQFDCDIHAGTLADIVERTARRFLE